MTQDRRITDKLPGQPLQWEEAATPAAAPAAGQAGLATELQKDIDSIADELEDAAAPYGGDFADTVNGCAEALRQIASRAGAAPTIGCGGSGKCGVGDLPCLGCNNCPEFAAPVAADTEQARDAARYRWLRDQMSFSQASEGGVEMYLRDGIATEHHDIHTDWQLHLWDASVDATIDAAMGVAPLATPADAGAGLTPERIAKLINAHTVRAAFGSSFDHAGFACAIEREVLARLSTSGAPVTASDTLVDTLTDYLRREMPAGTVICRPDWWAMKIARAISSGQSPAPVTAEPAQSIDTPTVLDIMSLVQQHGHEHYLAGVNNDEADPKRAEEIKSAICALVAKVATPAPARQAESLQTRDAIRNEVLEEAAKAIEKSYVSIGQPDDPHPDAVLFNGGIYDCAKTIRALKSMERAADAAETRDAKGGA